MHETCASLCSPAVCLLRHRIFISLTRCPMESWLTVGTTQTSFLDQTPWQNHKRRESLEAPINWRKVGICCNDVYSFFRTNRDFRGALLTHMVWAHVALFQFDRLGSWGSCRSKQSWAKSELGLIASAVAFGGRTEQRTEAKRIRITIVLRKGSFGGHSCREDWMTTYWKGGEVWEGPAEKGCKGACLVGVLAQIEKLIRCSHFISGVAVLKYTCSYGPVFLDYNCTIYQTTKTVFPEV